MTNEPPDPESSEAFVYVRKAIQEALGNGADESAWRPTEYWLDAACRAIRKVVSEESERRDEREKILKELCFGDTFMVRWIKGDAEASWLQINQHLTEIDKR